MGITHIDYMKKMETYTSSVPFYNAYRLLAFVSEYKVVAWFFLITPSTGHLSHDMKTNPYKRETIN
jgi:hypothetical protein